MMKYVWGLLLVLLCCAPLVQAQECAEIMQEAIDLTSELCSGVARNQACYGNLAIDAIPQPDAADFKFEDPGDIVDVTSIQTLNLSAMASPDEWGLALMSLQANLPDTVPGQNVTVLLFGDTAIENAGTPDPATVSVTADTTINVRSGPGASNRVLSQLPPNVPLTADGQNEAGDWLRVQLDDVATGWVSAGLVTVEGDVSALAVVETTTTEEGTVYAPMQAFYFMSGVGAPNCAEAPQDGILVQTPDGVGEISLLINEVSIELGSTAYIRGQHSGTMTFDLLEGSSTVTVDDTTVRVLPGTRAEIPLDADGNPGEPVLTTIPDDGLQGLEDLITLLPKKIELPDILTSEELAKATNVTGPEEGTWRISDLSGPSNSNCGGAMGTFTGKLAPTDGGFTLLNLTFVGQGGGVFTAQQSVSGSTWDYAMTLVEPGLMTGEVTLTTSLCSTTWTIQAEKE